VSTYLRSPEQLRRDVVEMRLRAEKAEERVVDLEAEAATADRELNAVNAQVNGLHARVKALEALCDRAGREYHVTDHLSPHIAGDLLAAGRGEEVKP
jgi:multidrug resistance efflux pump